jgi:tetratricopeptide (TPR) repeat protein
MKLAATLIAVLTATCIAAAQGQSTTPTQPAQESKPAQPTGRPPIQAKTPAEFQAYQAAIANGSNPEALEKASDDFATKFPDSDVRVLLYRACMNSYQTAGKSDKMMDMGLKILGIDKDDPEALIVVSEVLQEHTSPTDLDRDQRANQAVAYAQHALETIDTDLAVPVGSPPDKVEAYKRYLRSTALATIGTVQYKREQYQDAEGNLRKAIEADAANPDAVVILRLALTLDQEKKYAEALQQVNRAVELTKEDTDVGKMARNERDRLVIETNGNNGNAAPAAAPAPPPQNPAPPSH